MKKLSIDIFIKMLHNIQIGIARKQDAINRLNVFPVPDGDTGSNVMNTISGGIYAIKDNKYTNISDVAKDFSKGTLLSARGNSGVITSQIYRGLSVGLEKVGKEMTTVQFIKALDSARDYAYKSVSNPTEGTILSVLDVLTKRLKKEKISNFTELFETINIIADSAVKNTPNQLQVLKDARVVDSGAYSFERSLYGMSKAVFGEKYEFSKEQKNKVELSSEKFISKAPLDILEGYCTEAMITLRDAKSLNKQQVEELLKKHGNSIVVVKDEDILKIHVHSKQPGKVLTEFQKYGEFMKIKVDNMDVQVKDNESLKQKNESALLAVAQGNGYISEYKSFKGVYVLDGAQGSNPSVQDFLDKINLINSNNIFILPNNSNIVLAANKARDMYKGDKKIFVIPTKSTAQGLSLAYIFNPAEDDYDVLYDELNYAYKESSYANVTQAIKDAKLNGVTIKKGEYMGIVGKVIITSQKTEYRALQLVTEYLIKKEYDIISLFYGKEVKQTQIKKMSDYTSKMEDKNDGIEFIIKKGGQDIYLWEISAEK